MSGPTSLRLRLPARAPSTSSTPAPAPESQSVSTTFARARSSAVTSTIHNYLPLLPASSLQRLYSLPSTCLAIYRLLPAEARCLVAAMAWMDDEWDERTVERWGVRGRGSEAGRRHLQEALEALTNLHILTVTPAPHQKGAVKLSPSYKASYRRALTGGGDHNSFGVACPVPDRNAVDIKLLDEFANQQWETILHFMVGSDLGRTPSKAVLNLMQRSGLMDSESGTPKITSRGFQFLLEDVNTQLWDLLLQYLEMAEERSSDLVEVLGLIFMLGSLRLGQDYSTEHLTPTQSLMLDDLRDYGLVYQRSNSKRFYPTRLATTLTSSAAPLVSGKREDEDKGFMIVETNYRVYAYTSNPLQINILNLFIQLKSRFPNLVVGVITRESVKRALENGIKADQIVSYLTTHAHPQMRKQNPLLPPTVVDQIRLWELEKNRVKDEEGYLYQDFKSQADYDLVVAYARQLGVVTWEREETRMFFVSSDGHLLVRDFIKRRMAGGGGG